MHRHTHEQICAVLRENLSKTKIPIKPPKRFKLEIKNIFASVLIWCDVTAPYREKKSGATIKLYTCLFMIHHINDFYTPEKGMSITALMFTMSMEVIVVHTIKCIEITTIHR